MIILISKTSNSLPIQVNDELTFKVERDEFFNDIAIAAYINESKVGLISQKSLLNSDSINLIDKGVRLSVFAVFRNQLLAEFENVIKPL
jgi:hypothetical protein